MSRAITLTLVAAALLGCDGAVIGEDFPHHPPAAGEPAACVLPRLGATCPIPIEGEAALDAVEEAAWCPAGDLRSDARPDGVVELACEPLTGGWRLVAGVVAPGWGVAYLAPDATLVHCDADGRVAQIMPLLGDGFGRLWHALTPDDSLCLVDARCFVVSDQCEAPR